MKKNSALLLLLCCNALLVFFQVHQQGLYVKMSYELQKQQAQLRQLKEEQAQLIYQLQKAQQPDIIQEIAEKDLQMIPIALKNIRTIKNEAAAYEQS